MKFRRIRYSMSAGFFRKRIWIIIGSVTVVFAVLGVYFYTRYLKRATVAAVSQNYYFLVSESTHVEASTHEIQLNGGAGYLLEMTDREYVAISAYLSSEEANAVQESLTEETKICKLGVEKLYFKSKEDKRKAKQIIGAFETFENAIDLLTQETKRLEEGATQESSKRILETLKRQFLFLKKEYDVIFPSYANVCKKAAERLSELIAGTVYAKDLRYLQCTLCHSYVTLAQEFSV